MQRRVYFIFWKNTTSFFVQKIIENGFISMFRRMMSRRTMEIFTFCSRELLFNAIFIMLFMCFFSLKVWPVFSGGARTPVSFLAVPLSVLFKCSNFIFCSLRAFNFFHSSRSSWYLIWAIFFFLHLKRRRRHIYFPAICLKWIRSKNIKFPNFKNWPV